MSPVANSVAFLAFLFPSSLAVDLPTLFSPKNHDVAHVPTTISLYFLVCLWVSFLLQLFLLLRRCFCVPSDILNMRRQIHISNASIFLMSLFCSVHVSLPYSAILRKNALTIRFFQLEAEGSTHEIFLLVESFLWQCNATFYFTFSSAVLGHHTSKVAELCD